MVNPNGDFAPSLTFTLINASNVAARMLDISSKHRDFAYSWPIAWRVPDLFHNLFDELRFQAHLTEAWDFAIDVVITVDQTDATDLGADFDHQRRPLDLQVFLKLMKLF